MRGAGRARSAAALLLLLGAGLAAPFRAGDWTRRIARLPAAFASRTAGPPPGPSAFSFDPGYSGFLDAVARSTPADATIALSVPAGELYVYEAAYRLAPRRVVAGDSPEARWVARYEPGAPPRGGRALPGGSLERR